MKRSKRGATLALILICTFVVCLIGVGFFFLARIFGGGRELQNTVDAGNLHLAKQALVSPGVSSAGIGALNENNPDEAQFIGVADRNGAIALNNINRVFAQALIVSANARAMEAEGVAGPLVSANVDSVLRSANNLGSALAQSLADRVVMNSTFSNMADSNSVRMLNPAAAPAPGDVELVQHDVAYTDRGFASNIRVLDAQIPPSSNTKWTALKSSHALSVTTVPGNFLLGYMDGINFDGQATHNIHFVPLKSVNGAGAVIPLNQFTNSQPHLISQTTFTNDRTPGAGAGSFTWANAVPNAFRDRGSKDESTSRANLALLSCAISKSMQPPTGYLASMPRGFIRITNTACSALPAGKTYTVPVASGQDVYTFLNGTPVCRALGPTPGYYVPASDPAGQTALSNIIAANNAGTNPSSGDMANLKGPGGQPPSLADAKQINDISPIVNNGNCDAFNYTPEIESAFNVGGGGGGGTNMSPCIAAVELANLDFLTQRAKPSPANATALIDVAGYSSGATNVPTSRGPLPWGQVKFTSDATLDNVLSTGSGANFVKARMAQRCAQIFPDQFSGAVSDLVNIVGWNSKGIPIGGRAYIYFQPTGASTTNFLTGQMVGNLVIGVEGVDTLPPWLEKVKSQLPDGQVAAFDINGTTVPFDVGHPSGSGGPTGIINVNHDWYDPVTGAVNFPHPYDIYPNGSWIDTNFNGCNKNTFLAVPASGINNLLLEVQMGTCFDAKSACPADQHGDAAAGGGITVPKFGNCDKMPPPGFTGPC